MVMLPCIFCLQGLPEDADEADVQQLFAGGWGVQSSVSHDAVTRSIAIAYM
jgi:hypothetical protein